MTHLVQSTTAFPSSVTSSIDEVTEGEGRELLNAIPRKTLTRFQTAGMFLATRNGPIEIRPTQGRYRNFAFTVSTDATGQAIDISYYGRSFAVIYVNGTVAPAPCLSNPEDTQRFWSDGSVEIIIDQLTAIVRGNVDQLTA